MNNEQENTESSANTDGRDKETEDEIASRFPRPEQIALPRGNAIPDPPKATYSRQHLRRDTDPAPEGSRGLIATIGQGRREGLRSLGQAGTVGISLVVSIMVGAGLGWLVDRYLLHSTQTPWGLIVGFMLGVVSGFANLVRVANQLSQDTE